MKKSKLERLWRHKGIFCLAIGTDLGHRCGYCLIPDSHKYTGRFDAEALKRYEEYAKDNHEPPYAALFDRYKDEKYRFQLARQEFWENTIDVHGGITYADEQTSAEWEQHLEGGDGVPSGYWIGFDCAHLYDGRDDELLKSFGDEHYEKIKVFRSFERDGRVWTTEDVVAEVERMADQIYSLDKDRESTAGGRFPEEDHRL